MSDIIIRRRRSYLTGCMSPSCIPVAVHENYSRVHVGKSPRRRRLRRIIRKILSEGKRLYSPGKALTFQYDAVSYSQNFDDGCRRDDDCARSECAAKS